MSKSGSKALSKSVNSVVKSVESVVSSVVPKNMNMKHVLLAILVGLLLCMLMGNTVEGLIPTQETADPPCPTGFTITQLAAGDGATESDGTTRATDADQNNSLEGKYGCLRDSGTRTKETDWGPLSDLACTAESGPYNSVGNVCNTYCDNFSAPAFGSPNSISATSGLCKSDINIPVQKNICSKILDEDTCVNTQACSWKLFSDKVDNDIIADPIHLRGIFNNFMNLAGFTRNGCPAKEGTGVFNAIDPTGTAAMVTRPLNLFTSADGVATSTTLGDDAKINPVYADWLKLKGDTGDGQYSTEGSDEYKDFFYLMFGPQVDQKPDGTNKPKMSNLINDSGNLPAKLKTELYNITKNEEELWDVVQKLDPGNLLSKNGGRLIAGYNQTSGFVIRNSASKPTLLPSSNTRVHVGAGCEGSWNQATKQWSNNVSCSSTSTCISEADRKSAIKEEAVTTIGDFVVPFGDSTIRNYCKLDDCANKYPECQMNNIFNQLQQSGVQNLVAAVYK